MKLRRLLWLGGILAGGYYVGRAVIERLQPPATPLSLQGSVAVITGASSGIGRAVAVALAQRGARVVLAARREELLTALAQEIAGGDSDKVLVVPTDVTDPAQLEGLVDATLAQFGQIDVLVNNAGVPSGGPLHTLPLKTIQQTLAVNLTASIALTSLCLPTMIARGQGRIVNIASILGGVGFPFYSAYAASKVGLVGFSERLRRELDGTGVGVTCVMPTWTQTDMLTPEAQARMTSADTAIDTAIDSPAYVAERTLEALLRGEHTVYFGGNAMRAAFWLERHFPAAMNIYFRLITTPEAVAISRGGL